MARQELINGETYLSHRTKINDMTAELYTYEFTTTIINATITAAANEPPLPGDFIDVATLDIANLAAGLYEIKFSIVWEFATGEITDAFIINILGSVVTPIVRIEAKDDDDVLTWAYFFPINHAGGAFNLTLQAVIETGGEAATVDSVNVIVDRKG